MIKNKVKVIKSLHSNVLIPFQAEKGEVVNGKEKPTQWEGWLYCKNKMEFSVGSLKPSLLQ